MTAINTIQNKQELLDMVASALKRNSDRRRRIRTKSVRVSSGLSRKHIRTRRVTVSSDQENSSRNVIATGFYPYDPSYIFCGVGSVPNYKKKRFARLRQRVSLIG